MRLFYLIKTIYGTILKRQSAAYKTGVRKILFRVNEDVVYTIPPNQDPHMTNLLNARGFYRLLIQRLFRCDRFFIFL